MQWIKQRNILAFPFGWQTPAKTEEWAYERCVANLPENHFVEMVCFPWATLIDLLRNAQLSKAQIYLDALQSAPPRKTLIRATICQHIYLQDVLPLLLQLKITDIYWSHAVIGQDYLESIRVHPFPIYPVRCAEMGSKPLKPLSQRRYLYSFIGAYDAGLYLTPVRQWLFDLPARADAHVQSRTTWHFEAHVYGDQVNGVSMDADQLQQHILASMDYEEVMRETIFCLSPSGSGPNSIRLWEALGFGCIPVVLSDTLRLPGDVDLWHSATVQIPEQQTAVASMSKLLASLDANDFSLAAKELWRRYGLNDFIYDISRLSPTSLLS